MKRQGQIWIETVIYTLIIIVIIGILLSILTPALNQRKDQAVIEQSMNMLNELNGAIEDARFYGAGNSIPVEMQLKKGELLIDGEQDYILFSITSNYLYSEANQSFMRGKINITSVKQTNGYEIYLKMDYKGIINLTWDNRDVKKIIQPASNPYELSVSNLGRVNELININLNS